MLHFRHGPPLTIVSVSGLEEDQAVLEQILRQGTWRLRHAQNCREAYDCLAADDPAIVICESHLSDGTWLDVLRRGACCATPPAVIVSSRAADDRLWAEVLNLGGCDVLAKPFDAKEVLWAAAMARQGWETRASQAQRAIA